MAQTLQQQEDCRENSASDNKPPIQQQTTTTNTSSDVVKQTTATTTTTNRPTGRISKGIAVASRSSSVSSPPIGATDSPSLTNPLLLNRYQPSKVFISKCRTELETLLNTIKDDYRDEIKNLYSDELYADFFVEIGEEFKKPLHKCIIASRAFKLYNSLKAFKLVEKPSEQDIIISEFQGKDTRNNTELQQEESSETQDLGEETSPEPSTFTCSLPSDLINPDLLLNFARRAYLDQDIAEEEFKLNQRLIDWLKSNKPELIRVPRNEHSPDHRESFRTIRPDFEESLVIKTAAMSVDHSNLINLGDETESNVDDMDEASQATSTRDESLTGSLLTRTETFELIPRSNQDSSPIATPSRNILTDPQATDDDVENHPIPYAPTTRTGLKPKTFTTPVGIRATSSRVTASSTGGKQTQTQTPTKTSARDEPKSKAASSATKASINKQGSSGGSSATPSAAKRSSISSNQSDATSDTQSPKSVPSKVKTAMAAAGGQAGKANKPTLITRAHPISMERSQSPSTNIVIKGSGRNFIAANKRMISQMEKKIPAAATTDQSIDDSEAEASDTSLFVLEPLTSENLVAQMDKFTLVSYSKLADALSKMFIDAILSDTIILVKDGKEINAHKCILAARSPYLAELINKQCLPLATSESVPSDVKQQLKIDLTHFSHPAVYFSIMHIYSGIVKVPEDLDLDELTKLAHLLHINTLRQVCTHNLRMNYCHFFHKPCNVCCLGVLKTLPLAWRYDYTELYSKCLHWIGSHFASIFCLREFSELKPHDLIEECYTATLNQLTPENIIPKTIECQKLLKNLPRVKWTESIICLVGRQLEDFCHYVAENYEKILQSESFMNLGKNCWECEILEENLLAAMNHLKPDSGCKTLIQLHKIECSIESYCDDPRNVSDSFSNLISKMRKYCERYLLKEAAAVVHCSSWRHMNPSLQKRIKDQAIITTDFDEPTKQLASKPKLPSMSRVTNHKSNSGNSPTGSDSPRSPSNRSTPEARLKSPSSTYLPPPKNKAAAARHVKVLK